MYDLYNKKPMEMNDYDFLEWAKDFFTDDEWDRLCDLLSRTEED